MNLTSTRTILRGLMATAFLLTYTAMQASEMGGNPFHCPEEHVYLHCGELHDNYDYYGYPKPAYGYGHDVIIYGPYTTEYLDHCGRGKIIRKWKIKYHYDWYWCEQTIHISDPYGQTFDGYHDVHWPKDYEMKDCHGSKHPDHMPYGYGWPEFKHHGCSQLGLNYEDKIHPYSVYAHGDHGYGYGSHYHHPCKVIYRTWTLIDWCQYNGHGYGGHYTGKWTHVQKIYVYDDVAPEITYCPEDIEADGGDCDGNKVYVDIPKLQAEDDCGDVYYSYTRKHLGEDYYHSSYNGYGVDYGGNDASGYYEPGKTLVTFKAYDVCGNTTECSFIVNVVAVDNKPPTVIAISSITAVLMMTDTNEGMVEVWPEEFNSSSYDNCTAKEDLKFRLEPSVFTCENYGSNEVKFIVEDEAGNFDYTIVEVIVQANAMPCMGGVINGSIVSDQGNVVPDVEVTLTDGQTKMTDGEGIFTFEDVVMGTEGLQITPRKELDPMEGIDMYDYTLLSLHVEGIRELKDPRKLIAADINGDRQVDYLDLLDLQKLILGIDQQMPGDSWKFYKKGLEFPDSINPLMMEIPKNIDIPAIYNGEMLVEFEGIKIGDLGTLLKVPVEGDLRVNNMFVQDQLMEAGDVITVPFVLSADASANVFSFTLDINSDEIEILEIEGKALSQRGSLNTLDPSGAGDAMVASWFSMSEKDFKAGETMIELTVRAKQSLTLSNSLKMSSSHVKAESVGAESGKASLQLIYQQLVQNDLTLYQNSPNPFTEQTTVGFYLPEAGEASLTVRDLTGKEILTKQGIFEKGYQEMILVRNELPASGVLLYELRSGGMRQARKMVLVN